MLDNVGPVSASCAEHDPAVTRGEPRRQTHLAPNFAKCESKVDLCYLIIKMFEIYCQDHTKGLGIVKSSVEAPLDTSLSIYPIRHNPQY